MTFPRIFESSQLARAEYNRRSSEVELGALQAAGPEADRVRQVATQLLELSANAVRRGRVDDAWHFLNDARRAMTALRPTEWQKMAAALLIESEKISKWRRRAIEALIQDPSSGSHAALVEALRLRDEWYETRYHRIRLFRDQMKVLLTISVVTLLVALVLFATSPVPLSQWDHWSWRLVTMTLAFGILGACVSSARSVTKAAPKALNTDIPELVASSMLPRIVLGATPGLVAYVFLQAGLVTVGHGPAGALTVAFVGGFSERLIVRVAESIAGDKPEAG